MQVLTMSQWRFDNLSHLNSFFVRHKQNRCAVPNMFLLRSMSDGGKNLNFHLKRACALLLATTIVVHGLIVSLLHLRGRAFARSFVVVCPPLLLQTADVRPRLNDDSKPGTAFLRLLRLRC